MVRSPITLAGSCGWYLAQASDLVRVLSPEVFAAPLEIGNGASIGQHLRHCLDHVDAFLDGLPVKQVDYDRRARGGPVETQPAAALSRMERMIRRLQEAGVEDDVPLLVKLDCGLGSETWRRSTAGRELQFLVSHLVHHFAIMAILCRYQGIEPGESFGVAPSTLAYRRGA